MHKAKTSLLVFFISLIIPVMTWAFEFGGLADITYKDSTLNKEERGAFTLGALDLYATSRTDKISTFVEFLLEFNEAGEGFTDLERLYVRYTFGDQLSLTGGRIHTSLGYWSQAYHHGKHMFVTTERPEFLDFEDESGILPTHTIGLTAAGNIYTDVSKIGYDITIANGSKLTGTSGAATLDPNNVKDDNDNKALILRFILSPTAIEGLQLGLGGYFSMVDSASGAVNGLSQNIYIGDIAYINGPVEFLSEYFYLVNNNKGRDYFNNLYYIQVAYTLFDLIAPYYRYENSSINSENDPYFNEIGSKDYHKNIIGLKYDINYKSAIKAEANFINKRGVESHKLYALQWTYSF